MCGRGGESVKGRERGNFLKKVSTPSKTFMNGDVGLNFISREYIVRGAFFRGVEDVAPYASQKPHLRILNFKSNRTKSHSPVLSEQKVCKTKKSEREARRRSYLRRGRQVDGFSEVL